MVETSVALCRPPTCYSGRAKHAAWEQSAVSWDGAGKCSSPQPLFVAVNPNNEDKVASAHHAAWEQPC